MGENIIQHLNAEKYYFWISVDPKEKCPVCGDWVNIFKKSSTGELVCCGCWPLVLEGLKEEEEMFSF